MLTADTDEKLGKVGCEPLAGCLLSQYALTHLCQRKGKAMRVNRNVLLNSVKHLPKSGQRRSVFDLTVLRSLRFTAGLFSFLTLCLAQSPDYTNKADILNGRRVLLQVDDIVLFGEAKRTGTDFHDMGFNFYNSTNSSFSASGKPPLANTSVVPTGLRSLVIYGRWWASTTDIPALVFHENPDDLSVVLDRRTNDMHAVVPGVKEQTGTPCAIAEDFTGDGYDDLVLATTPANQGDGHIVLVTASDTTKPSPPKFGTPLPVSRCMAMTQGDFNGDGNLDLAYVSPAAKGSIQITIFTFDPKALTFKPAGSYTVDTTPEGTSDTPITHASITAGAFRTGDAHQQLAIAYAPDGRDVAAQTVIKTVDIDDDFRMKEVDHFDTGSWPRIDGLIGVQAARLFGTDPSTYLVFFFAWHGNAGREGAANKYLKVFSVDPTLKMTAHPNYDFSTYDCVSGYAIGNFDYHVKDPSDPNKTELSLDRQLALVGGDCDNPTTLDIHVLTLATDFTVTDKPSTVLSPFPNLSYLTLIPGDAQGRSLVLGTPNKITLNQNIQTSVVVAAPPSHVDYIVPSGETTPIVLNISALPQGFKTSYDTTTKGQNQSTNTSGTSWGVGATQSINQTISIGDIDEGEGFEEKSSFTAAQQFKGESDKENGSYSGYQYDVSSSSGNGDNIWFSATRLNVWTYPVIGKTVCPKSIPNCSDSQKVPLTLIYSAPDQIENQSTSQQVSPWYQPTWEYGNLFSYPVNLAQLQGLFPEIDLLTNALQPSFSVSGGPLSIACAWTAGESSGSKSSFTQNYSFDASLSVQGAADLGDFSLGGGYSLGVSSSFGFSSQTTNRQSMDTSKGIAISKPGGFLDAPIYGYTATPYVYGRNKPANIVDTSKAPTEDVASFGALRSAFTADIVSSSAGGFWRQAYGNAPDIGLSHPARWAHSADALQTPVPRNCRPSGANNSEQDCFDVHEHRPSDPWVSPSLFMQGFFITDAPTDPSKLGAGPNLSFTHAGTMLTLQVRVYNFSFAALPPGSSVHVQFYGMPFNTANNTPAGPPFKISGKDVVLPPVPPLTDDANGRNWAYASTDFDTTPYRDRYLVFWVLVWAENGIGANRALIKEIAGHGLTGLPVDVQTDMSQVPVEMNWNVTKDKMVSYSNNLGFYRSILYVAPNDSQFHASLQAADKTKLRLMPVELSARSAVRNQPIEVSTTIRPQAVPAPGALLRFYDGHPDEGGTLIHVEHLPWIRAGERHRVRILYRPQKPGLRRIWAFVNQGTPDESVRRSPILCVGNSCFFGLSARQQRNEEAPDPREKP